MEASLTRIHGEQQQPSYARLEGVTVVFVASARRSGSKKLARWSAKQLHSRFLELKNPIDDSPGAIQVSMLQQASVLQQEIESRLRRITSAGSSSSSGRQGGLVVHGSAVQTLASCSVLEAQHKPFLEPLCRNLSLSQENLVFSQQQTLYVYLRFPDASDALRAAALDSIALVRIPGQYLADRHVMAVRVPHAKLESQRHQEVLGAVLLHLEALQGSAWQKKTDPGAYLYAMPTIPTPTPAKQERTAIRFDGAKPYQVQAIK